jgi:fructokinase
MFDVTAVGDMLIDFTPCGKSENGNALFERNPGGATANVLVAISRLGGKTAFIGKVGKDSFGYFLKDVLEENKVDTTGMILTTEANTTLAFVHLDDKGDRSFSFYRDPGAETLLTKEEIWFEAIQGSKIFYYSSVSMSHNPARESIFEAIRFAKRNNKLISHDVNLRPLLWDGLEEAKEVILKGLPYVDILKVSEEELEFLTGTTNIQKGSEFFINNYDTSMVLVTLGPGGCYYSTSKFNGHVPAYKVNAVDTTGAGDAFMGAVLYKITGMGEGVNELSDVDLKTIADFACAAGSLTTQKRGAIPAMPTLKEVGECINLGSHLL